MQRAYSPAVLRILDAIGLTDVFHAWWFVALMVLVSLSIVAASIERFPNSWRYFARPYKYPERIFGGLWLPRKHFRFPTKKADWWPPNARCTTWASKPERVVRERSLRHVRRTQPHLRNGGLHRARQPVADFLWWHRGRALGLARHPQPERGSDSRDQVELRGWREEVPCLSRFAATLPARKTIRTVTEKMVVEAGSREGRPAISRKKKSW